MMNFVFKIMNFEFKMMSDPSTIKEKGPLFTGAEFSIDGKSRIVLLGENGNGKTTLVRSVSY